MEFKSIQNFKKGDNITRLIPIINEAGEKDYSLVGTKVTFLGIANSCAYFNKKTDSLVKYFYGMEEIPIKLPLELCESGWEYYMEPSFLSDEKEEDTIKSQKAAIEKAIKDEDYLYAEFLKKQMNNKKDHDEG